MNSSTQQGMNLSILQRYANDIIGIINFIFVPALMAIALLTFFWGVYTYFILGADSEDKRADGRQFVLWSIIGFVVVVSVWGLVYMVGITLGVAPGDPRNIAPPSPTIMPIHTR